MPHVRETRLPARVDELARALHGAPGLAVLAAGTRGALSAADARFSFLAAHPVERTAELVPAASAPCAGWAGFRAAPQWVGAIPYEARRAGRERPCDGARDERSAPLLTEPCWLRYDACARIDHATGIVAIEADDGPAAERLERALLEGLAGQGAQVRPTLGRAGDRVCDVALTGATEAAVPPPFTLRLRGGEPAAAHRARVAAVLDLIARGEVYQVNLARRVECDVRGDRLALFFALRALAPAPYALFAELGPVTVCAASPELALEACPSRGGFALRTAPIKGTRPRGVDAPTDAASARSLDADPKERAELIMAVDLHRNDLGRVAVPGSVRVRGGPRLFAGRTVWSRVAEVVAWSSADLATIAEALLPCGSVTGAPKVRAMAVIAALEPTRRGLYTGAFGYVGRDGSLVLAVAIRTLELSPEGRGHYGTGGGIVADSDPERELEETRWKSVQLANLADHGGFE